MAIHKCYIFRLEWGNLLSPAPGACIPFSALRSIEFMTGEPQPRYNPLQWLGESGACGIIGRIRLSVSTAIRTYEPLDVTHVIPFHTYRFHST